MTRLYSYSIGKWEYLFLLVRCYISGGHSLKFNSGDPACSKCWTRAPYPKFSLVQRFLWRSFG